MVEGWLRHPSEAWPYEALKRGLPRPFAKRRKKLGEGKHSAQILPEYSLKRDLEGDGFSL